MADDFTGADFAAASSAPAGDSAPVSNSEPSAQPGAATTQPATTQSAPVQASVSTPSQPLTSPGPIPFDVHKTALENARAKAAADAVAAYAWAKDVPQEEGQLSVLWGREFNRDPVAFITRSIEKLSTDPTYGPQLLAASRGGQAEAAPAMVPVQLEDGTVVQMPRDPAAWLAYHQKQWLGQVQQELAPIRQTHAEQVEAARVAQEKADAAEFGRTRGADAKTWPGMDNAEKVAELKAWLAAQPLQTGDPREVELLLNAGYRQIILPTLHVAARQAVMTDLTTKSTANTHNPAQASASAPKSIADMEWGDALRHVSAQMAGR